MITIHARPGPHRVTRNLAQRLAGWMVMAAILAFASTALLAATPVEPVHFLAAGGQAHCLTTNSEKR